MICTNRLLLWTKVARVLVLLPSVLPFLLQLLSLPNAEVRFNVTNELCDMRVVSNIDRDATVKTWRQERLKGLACSAQSTQGCFVGYLNMLARE